MKAFQFTFNYITADPYQSRLKFVVLMFSRRNNILSNLSGRRIALSPQYWLLSKSSEFISIFDISPPPLLFHSYLIWKASLGPSLWIIPFLSKGIWAWKRNNSLSIKRKRNQFFNYLICEYLCAALGDREGLMDSPGKEKEREKEREKKKRQMF